MAHSEPEPRFALHEECGVLTAAAAGQLTASPGRFRHRKYRSGSFVWMADDRPTRVLVIVSGRVEVSTITSKGDTALVRILEPGQMAGELCFCKYHDEPHGTQAVAITRCETAEISYAGFRKAIQEDAALTAQMLESFCGRVAAAEHRTAILSVRSAEQRLGKMLLHLAQRHGSQKALSVGHRELAFLACLTRPHVTVLMNKFRLRGCVSYERGSALTIHEKMLRSILGE